MSNHIEQSAQQSIASHIHLDMAPVHEYISHPFAGHIKGLIRADQVEGATSELENTFIIDPNKTVSTSWNDQEFDIPKKTHVLKHLYHYFTATNATGGSTTVTPRIAYFHYDKIEYDLGSGQILTLDGDNLFFLNLLNLTDEELARIASSINMTGNYTTGIVTKGTLADASYRWYCVDITHPALKNLFISGLRKEPRITIKFASTRIEDASGTYNLTTSQMVIHEHKQSTHEYNKLMGLYNNGHTLIHKFINIINDDQTASLSTTTASLKITSQQALMAFMLVLIRSATTTTAYRKYYGGKSAETNADQNTYYQIKAQNGENITDKLSGEILKLIATKQFPSSLFKDNDGTNVMNIVPILFTTNGGHTLETGVNTGAYYFTGDEKLEITANATLSSYLVETMAFCYAHLRIRNGQVEIIRTG